MPKPIRYVHRARHQVGKGQKISAMRNESQGYQRLEKPKPPPKTHSLPKGHTPFTYLHPPQYGEYERLLASSATTKREQQQGGHSAHKPVRRGGVTLKHRRR